MTLEEAVLRRIRIRSAVLALSCAAGAFLFGWQSAVSLTICAAVVIFSFLVLERLTERFLPRHEQKGKIVLVLLLVTAAGLVLLGLVFRWKGFRPIAGVVGLSVVVAAIGAEIFQRGGEAERE